MVGELEAVAWPRERASEAMEALARAARLPLPNPPPVLSRTVPAETDPVKDWLDVAAQRMGLELKPLHTRHGEVESVLGRAAPALVELTSARGPGVIALLRVSSSGKSARVIAPDETAHEVPLSTLTDAVRARVEARQGPLADRILERAGLPESQRVEARRTLLGVQLANTHLIAAHMLRLPPGARWGQHLRSLGAGWRLGLLFLLAALVQVGMLSGWWLIGRGAFEGRLEPGWLWAWALMGVTLVPLQAALTWLQGSLVMDFSALLRRHLLAGALALPVDEARRGGMGEYVGRTFESSGLEQLALTGGFSSLLAVTELVLAASVMVTGPAGGYGLAVLGGFCAVLGVLIARQATLFRKWSEARVVMTHALIERMIGHRTRLAQEQPGSWHVEEDHELAHYAEVSEQWDGATARVLALARRGLLPVAILATLPGVLAGASTVRIAVGVGAALMAARALGTLSVGALALVGARVLFGNVRPILEAAKKRSRESEAPTVVPPPSVEAPRKAQALLEVRDLVFKHTGAPRAVIERASLVVRAGERVLLEGPSGSGKSTFASIVTGLREPGSGLLLLGGLDMATWTAEGWGTRIAGAPQFHENHVVSGTLAMNLLLGRSWPPSTEDLNTARELCEELGLGELLARMPAGLQQLVGERGWQLSHGEQSRVFLARALLQRAQVVVLDESFGALDPITLRKVMACVEARAPTLLVIAHP